MARTRTHLKTEHFRRKTPNKGSIIVFVSCFGLHAPVPIKEFCSKTTKLVCLWICSQPVFLLVAIETDYTLTWDLVIQVCSLLQCRRLKTKIKKKNHAHIWTNSLRTLLHVWRGDVRVLTFHLSPQTKHAAWTLGRKQLVVCYEWVMLGHVPSTSSVSIGNTPHNNLRHSKNRSVWSN